MGSKDVKSSSDRQLRVTELAQKLVRIYAAESNLKQPEAAETLIKEGFKTLDRTYICEDEDSPPPSQDD